MVESQYFMQKSSMFVGDPFDHHSKEIKFALQIERTCHKIFDTIKELKKDGAEGTAAQMAARLYECFTDYWSGCVRNTALKRDYL